VPRPALPKWRINFGEAGGNVPGCLGHFALDYAICFLSPDFEFCSNERRVLSASCSAACSFKSEGV